MLRRLEAGVLVCRWSVVHTFIYLTSQLFPAGCCVHVDFVVCSRTIELVISYCQHTSADQLLLMLYQLADVLLACKCYCNGFTDVDY